MRELLEQVQFAQHPDIKLAFFDIDGTILDVDGHYSQCLKKQLQRIQKKGVRTAIASGRPQFATRFLQQELDLVDSGSFCAGAHLYQPRTREHIQQVNLPSSLCHALLDSIRASDLYCELYTQDEFFYEHDNAPFIRNTHALHLRCEAKKQDFDTLIGEDNIQKLLIGADLEKDDASLKYLESAFPECSFAYAALPAYPQWLFASIIHKNAKRETAFKKLLNYHGVQAKNVIAFGDAQSDMAFLQAAGIGVAMGNANDEVKAVANYITKPVWEDGLAYALERLV